MRGLATDRKLTAVAQAIREKAGLSQSLTLDEMPRYIRGIGKPVYTGTYRVVPKATVSVVLPSRDREMAEDVVVEEIPYYETSNSAGGKTVFIGG